MLLINRDAFVLQTTLISALHRYLSLLVTHASVESHYPLRDCDRQRSLLLSIVLDSKENQ